MTQGNGKSAAHGTGKNAGGRPLADWVNELIQPAMARYGFGEVDIITCWPEIVGNNVARWTEPLALQWPRRAPKQPPDGPRPPATLSLRVDGGFALELQHMQPEVIRSINRHVGWNCVGRLGLQQGPVKGLPPQRRRPAVDPRLVELANAATEGIHDEHLRAALKQLGIKVLGRQRRAV